ncbi:glycoside hydrolase family 28 protein [Streptacidiphilus sp. PB12-B1b]|uniref:glycoside hydrolase family 28 protein n=1 Tax=Streptacidiphilus sp. PB12-B1b TaxID=2705012 RepID=UPI001CDB61C5|nr:glycosyl hydrolase family 28 protein [Streptacidiphilus sp. PB12-B1b]
MSLTAKLSANARTFTAKAEETSPDTGRLQAALDACAGTGRAVLLVAGRHADFLSGPLTVHADETLVIGEGVTLYASRRASAYQNPSTSVSCGSLSAHEGGCKAFITVSGAHAGVMGERGSAGQGSIDGRGDLAMLGTPTSWWKLASQAQTAGDDQNAPRLIEADKADDFTAYDVNLLNAAMFHLYYQSGTGLTVWGVDIKTPATARNTDGIDIDSATDATVYDSYIEDGDDGIAIKTNDSATANVTVADSHFYGTHGISIGSETTYGVSNVLVANDTVDGQDSYGNVSGSDNGLRIKSDSAAGGPVRDVEYLDDCLQHMKAPLVFDTRYASASGSHIPDFTSITLEGVVAQNSLSGAKSDLTGYSSSDPLGLYLSYVKLDAASSTSEYADVTQYDSNLSASGSGVGINNLTSGAGSYPSCSFPSYPTL